MPKKPERKKNPHAVALGSLGGKARMRDLSEAGRSQLGKIAVQAREEKRRKRKSKR